ncbi:3-methyl-2-oxobutanoate hydroxymethyltransferase [Sulfobacillus harzensis]|uniref:3-methyl-2-oxobutanoate hydroxymethyltransferase n=1 Tax=Sulfobacillus harzensis TaxID=2729629 RepID=A0A7Y0L4Y1_9FIRM|nr:3-methyl-2-oxobutanoate hydroxymethyltransferase [Sulfobacillus harzensis]NMP23047.1 3-methyl-2-oxobutanoate hydroxymethyltransferase [Sulfobacillus harzensis]
MKERMTAQKLKTAKGQTPLVWMTAYDYSQALLLEEAEIDVILVGDSVGTTVMGYDSTIPVTLDNMIYHASLVRRGAPRTMMVVDLPFLTYTDVSTALKSAGRLIQETLADAVKLEGGRKIIEQVDALVRHDIPVVGHLGLTPQSIHTFGGYRVQARTGEGIRALVDDARALDDHGISALVLEGIPDRVAAYVTQHVSVPTIGIGAGNQTDGQVLVFHDGLGLSSRYPKFAKPFADVRGTVLEGLRQYRAEVQSRSFPDDAHSYHVPDKEWNEFWSHVTQDR